MYAHRLQPQVKEHESLSAQKGSHIAQQSSYQQKQQQSREQLGMFVPDIESSNYIAEDFDEGDAQHAALSQHINSAQKQKRENQSVVSSKIQNIAQPTVPKVVSNLSLSPTAEFNHNNFINDQFVEFKMRKEVGGSYIGETEFKKPQRRSKEQDQSQQLDKLQNDSFVLQTTIGITSIMTPETEIDYSPQQNNQSVEYGDSEYTFRDENGQVQDSLGLLQNFMIMLIDTGQLSPDIYEPTLPPTLSLNLDALKPKPATNSSFTPEAETLKQPSLPLTTPQPEPENNIINKIVSQFRQTNTINIPQNITNTTRVNQTQSPYATTEAVSLDNIQNWAPQDLPLPLPLPTSTRNEVSLPPLLQLGDEPSSPQEISIGVDAASQYNLVYKDSSKVFANQESSSQLYKQEPNEEEDYEYFFSSLFAPLQVPSINIAPIDLNSSLELSYSQQSISTPSISDIQLQQFLGQAVINASVSYEQDEDVKYELNIPSAEIKTISPSPQQHNQLLASEFSQNLEMYGISPIQQAPPELIWQLFFPQKQQPVEEDGSSSAPFDEDIFDDGLGGMIPTEEQFGLLANQNFMFPAYPLMGGEFESSKSLWQKVRYQDSNDTELQEQISSFVSMLEISGLSSKICKMKKEVTIFSPINEVFNKMLQEFLIIQDDIDDLLQNMHTVKQILQYHVIQSKLEKMLQNKEYETMLQDENVVVEHNEIFGQVIARSPNTTAGSPFAFVRIFQGFTQILPCDVNTILIDEVLIPQPYILT